MRTLGRAAAAIVVVLTLGSAGADLLMLGFFGPFIAIPVALLPLGLVGALLMYRLPHNAVGWLVAASGLCFQLTFTAAAYAWMALVVAPGQLPAGELVNLVATAAFPPALGCAILMLLFFPSGRGLGGWWTWIERALMAVVALAAIGGLLRDPIGITAPLSAGVPDGLGQIPNPLPIHGPLAGVAALIAHFGDSGTVPVTFAGPIALIVRYRRSGALEREQIKWLAYGGSVAVVLIVASNFASGDLANWLWGLGVTSVGFLPIAIAFAIFRYRLYDIDILIRRTLIYAGVSAVLIAAYLGAVGLTEAILAPFTAGSGVAVAVSTLAVVALFQPVRVRVRAAVDRRFYRSTYDAERTLDAFSSRLRDEVDLGALERELVAAVIQTTQPDQVSVWLRAARR